MKSSIADVLPHREPGVHAPQPSFEDIIELWTWAVILAGGAIRVHTAYTLCTNCTHDARKYARKQSTIY